MRIEVFGEMLEVHSFGAQSVFRFGICNEINIVEEASEFFTEAQFNRLLVVNNRQFFFDQKAGKITERDSLKEVSLKLSDLPKGDEERIEAFLNAIGIETADDNSLGQFSVFSFGNKVGSLDCSDCWTNRGCALTFCGTDCDWSTGCSY